MANSEPQPAVTRADAVASGPTAEEVRQHNEWFTTTPDPWREIARLEFGGDRTCASTIYRMVVNAEPAQRPALETKLLEVLARPELTEAARQFVCRMLGLIGSSACVPAVTALLADNRSADDARRALDFVADAAVDEAYRAALGQLSGAALAGLIGSIGGRGDTGARGALATIAGDGQQDRTVRDAAERAVRRLDAATHR
ncbi:MAG TPA: hypothetical protein VHE13_13635 [Opitutus sp.]|nr:hypothetical protein [Opitutus sp.]